MNKFWTKNYPEGVATDIPVTDDTLVEFFDKTLSEYSNNKFSTNMGVSYTYTDIDDISLSIASYLQSLGLPQGSSIGVMMPNVNQYLPIVIGALRAGMVLTLINPLYTERELKHQLIDAEAKVLFILEPFCNTLDAIIDKTPLEYVVISSIGDMLKSKGTIVNLAAKYIKKAIPKYAIKDQNDCTVTNFKKVVAKGRKLSYTRPSVRPDDIAMIQYTGGTTGVAKGILITHRNAVYGSSQYDAWLNSIFRDRANVDQLTCVVALPMYHIFAFIISLLGIRTGQHLLLVTNPRDVDSFVKILSKEEFHLLPAVNTLFQALLNHPKFKDIDFSSLQLTLAGGMAATQETARKWLEVTGVHILEGWGMSETLGVGTANPLTSTEFNGSIGMPLPGIDIKLIDSNGDEVAVGEEGEIVIKGANVIKGYHNLDNTKFFTEDGYLKTGDVGAINDQGYVKLFDRKKDMLIVSGFNVYPNEVESVIEMHPKVRECSVVGIDDELQGQSVKVFIVKDDKSLSKKEIQEFCKKNLAGYKRPRHIEFIGELPKSTVGKILRHKLRSLNKK